MEQKADRLFLARGRLTVQARGYWFTAGGEKGPFGFYPHLKDAAGFPLFPDTQVHGDLLMAARWLSDAEAGFDGARIGRVFGRPGKNGAALLRMTDLELIDADKTGKKPASFFDIKPRIRIGEASGTVDRHMLVEREHAWLEGCVLCADLFMGYFSDENEMAACKSLVREAAAFLGGFGGSRSRGVGRGTAAVNWDEDETVSSAGEEPVPTGGAFGYFLTALTHFRNKPVERGATQVVGGMSRIRADQLRGWFVRAFRDLHGSWPEPREMATLRFPTLYPSDGERERPGFPPAVSTLRNEGGAVRDLWGAPLSSADDFDDDDENFFRTKTKPLPEGAFVTADAPGPSVIEPIRIEQRFRNAMDETFTTIENGLFAQDLIGRGSCFGGIFRLTKPDTPFSEKAFRLLTRVRPDIKGTLFEPRVIHPPPPSPAAAPGTPGLVIGPMRMRGDRLPGGRLEKGVQIAVGVEKRFNTTLGRPRRNRLVIAPGSVIMDGGQVYAAIAWPGFGNTIASPVKAKRAADTDRTIPPAPDTSLEWVITRSQAGLLRDYLHPSLPAARIREHIEDRIEKYRAKSEDILAALLTAVLDRLDADGVEAMRAFIRTYLEDLAVHLWKRKGE